MWLPWCSNVVYSMWLGRGVDTSSNRLMRLQNQTVGTHVLNSTHANETTTDMASSLLSTPVISRTNSQSNEVQVVADVDTTADVFIVTMLNHVMINNCFLLKLMITMQQLLSYAHLSRQQKLQQLPLFVNLNCRSIELGIRRPVHWSCSLLSYRTKNHRPNPLLFMVVVGTSLTKNRCK